MKTVSQSQLAQMLSGIAHATFATLSAITTVKTVANCPLGEVRKLSRVNVTLAHNYANSVNAQRAREGLATDFVPVARKWGKHVAPALIEHKGAFYMATRVNRSLGHSYLTRNAQGFWQVTDASKVAPYLPPVRDSGRQGTDKAILERDYSLANLVSLVVNGERLRVRGA